ncbi:MAG: tRNA 2-thiouridine(34) synthase MnmA [Chloroflexota bacterium]|nr:MAG: tRNA 2-thiouridine(34) synthase MnmA [Chloroflexota bacterium]
MSRGRVVVAMSGGVDSSIAAALLVEQGYEVIGVTLNVWPKQSQEEAVPRADACCALGAVEDARRVAQKLVIPHYVLNYRDLFAEQVIADFVEEYRRGRTPNPCIRCNERIKFAALPERIAGLGADYLATGHYVRLSLDATSGRYRLRQAVDPGKDQSYVLYMLTQHQLARCLFPLGWYRKEAARALARELDLVVADKPDSQEICFVTSGRYGDYLTLVDPTLGAPGPIYDLSGNDVGRHRGIAFYTVGQRHGLGLALGRPTYVVRIDAADNAIVVGAWEDLFARECVVAQTRWLSIEKPDSPIRATVKVRYHARPAQASLVPGPEGITRVTFDEPQRAITPGQAAVFYEEDLVLGGGTIL